MNIVIQCAGSKVEGAASFLGEDNRKVRFVANVAEARSVHPEAIFAHPDDASQEGQTWRERLVTYNQEFKAGSGTNALKLLPASKLYDVPIYERLVHFGKKNGHQTFILSAGWGLIPADFLTPDYDITFSSSAEDRFVRRGKRDRFLDLNLLPNDGASIIFLGGKSYLPLFEALTKKLSARKVVFYNSHAKPTMGQGFELKKFPNDGGLRTNWHYKCAGMIVSGEISLEG